MSASAGGYGPTRQAEAYLAKVRGRRRPLVPFDVGKLEEAARGRMSREAFAYVAGGAGSESTVAANRAAFGRRRIVPRMLRDVSARDTGVDLLGRRLPTPFLLAPVGALELVHPEADVAVARAAAAEGVPLVLSNQASRPMEECAEAMGRSPRWFQLYWRGSGDLVRSLLRRAETCGCEAVVVTLDTPVLGWRPRDLDLGSFPFAVGKGIAQYTSDPVFQELVRAAGAERARLSPRAMRSAVRLARAYPGPFLSNLRSGRPATVVREYLKVHSRPALTWDDLPQLRAQTSLPIVLKGVLHADDARSALELGVEGIVVSNHGGRQLDGEIAALDALPAVVEAVAGRAPVLLDSGVRGGVDALKALALGAAAVLIGRPYVYGLALAGEAGVREVIRNFVADFDLALALAGCSSVSELGPELLGDA